MNRCHLSYCCNRLVNDHSRIAQHLDSSENLFNSTHFTADLFERPVKYRLDYLD